MAAHRRKRNDVKPTPARAVYRRYAIVSDQDLREASAKLAGGTIRGTAEVSAAKTRGVR
jgi:hypothetical protein